MTVFVNNESLEVADGKIQAVLKHLQITHSRGFALAVNNEVVPKSSWEAFVLKERDKITLIKATQGG